MHGSILFQLQNFARAHPKLQWGGLAAAARAPLKPDPKTLYDDAMIERVVAEIGATLGLDRGAALRAFGQYLGPELIKMYRHLVQPEWGAADMLRHVESVIHKAVRQDHPGALPPRLGGQPANEPNTVQIRYASSRRMCELGEGLVEGLAAHYGERVKVSQPQCQHHGAAYCILECRFGGA